VGGFDLSADNDSELSKQNKMQKVKEINPDCHVEKEK
jgi:hypothetical protein